VAVHRRQYVYDCNELGGGCILSANGFKMSRDELGRFVDSIAKRKYPDTHQTKKCINEFGKLIIKRGHFKKAVIEFISKYDTEGKTDILEQREKQTSPVHSKIPY
jgi:hypothetical protein